MNAITTTSNNAIQGNRAVLSLFPEFVAWIDRGEKTTRTYLNNLKQFAAWIRYQGIETPVRRDIVAYREWLLTEHPAIALAPTAADGWEYRRDASGKVQRLTCKPTTAAAYLRSVSQFFRWTAANDLFPDIAANIHAPKLRNDHHRKDALEAADVMAIEKSIADQAAERIEAAKIAQKDHEGREQRNAEQGARLKAMYLLAVTAGLRCIELSRARIKDFQTRAGQSYLMVWGKGHSEADQRKALAPEVATAIREYLNTRKDRPTSNAPLFVSTGNRSGGKAIAPTTISTMLKRAMQAAGYDSERLTAHSLRHTAGTAAQIVTKDLFATQRYMRHSNPATTEIYLHVESEQQDAGIAARLYDYFHTAEARPASALH